MSSFNAISRWYTKILLLAQEKIIINSASKVVNWIVVDILKYMYLY